MKKRFFLLLLTLFLIENSHTNTAAVISGSESLIRRDTHLKKISFSNNLHVPISVLIYSYEGNEGTIKELYDIIDSINVTEKLQNNDDYHRKISLTVFMDKSVDNSTALQVIDKIAAEKKLKNRTNRAASDVDVSGLSVIYTKKEESIWLQDLLEFGTVQISGKTAAPAVFDLNYAGINKRSELIEEISRIFNLHKIVLNGRGQDDSIAGDSGGNVETTPDGTVYVGSRMTVDLKNDIIDKTRKDLLVLPTDWLYVGHVDEFFFFMPADNDCGFSAVFADPVEALNLIIRDKAWKFPDRKAVEESMCYFLKKKIKKQYYTFSDFDRTKPIRKIGNSKEVIHGKYTDWFVLQNLNAYAEIQNGIAIIKSSLSCHNPFIPLPVFFQEAHDEPYFESDGLVMKNPLTNALVLRDHIIIPDGHFSSIAVKRLKSQYKNNVHIINTKSYEENFGSIHCATNVIRDPRYVVKVKATNQKKITSGKKYNKTKKPARIG